MEFGKLFESKFVNQGFTENRTIENSLDLGWKLLSTLPKEELDRIDSKTLDKHYIDTKDGENLFEIDIEDEDDNSEEDSSDE